MSGVTQQHRAAFHHAARPYQRQWISLTPPHPFEAPQAASKTRRQLAQKHLVGQLQRPLLRQGRDCPHQSAARIGQGQQGDRSVGRKALERPTVRCNRRRDVRDDGALAVIAARDADAEQVADRRFGPICRDQQAAAELEWTVRALQAHPHAFGVLMRRHQPRRRVEGQAILPLQSLEQRGNQAMIRDHLPQRVHTGLARIETADPKAALLGHVNVPDGTGIWRQIGPEPQGAQDLHGGEGQRGAALIVAGLLHLAQWLGFDQCDAQP